MTTVDQPLHVDHFECSAEIAVLEEKLSNAEAEVRILLRHKRELEFQLVDVSQRIINVIRLLEEWEPVFADVPEMKATFVRICAALKMGDD